ncbi:response regulator [Micavibrio aeruginosavorus]|uniref:response regulator n=1 Tax=Micavibrio aeruginosavorus TaxID=349221 RepID=UPI003F4AABCD
MEIIRESAEHHFLTFVEVMRTDPKGWVGMILGLSRKYNHDAMINDLMTIPAKQAALAAEGDQWVAYFSEKIGILDKPTLYRFADGDVLLVTRILTEQQQDRLFDMHREITDQHKISSCDVLNFGREMMVAQKLADRKMLTQQRSKAYLAMADQNRVSSIAVRRDRRDAALILLVEDDRFTASYTTGILQKDYELVHSKVGEDAILAYIEHAPDVVFLDIHLPGLNGHETLDAIRKVDPASYIIMLSVDAVKDNIVNASKGGASGFLKKPFSKDRMLAIVQKSPFIKGAKVPSFN